MSGSLYLETTIVSYYTSRVSRDVIVLAHQEITRDWWAQRLRGFQVYISPVVIEEARRGDPEQAQRRLAAMEEFLMLEASDEVEKLAATYMAELKLPPSAIRDAAHLAFACAYELDYLLTWNCAHIANAEIRNHLMVMNMKQGLQTPTICTPEELMGMEV